MTGCCVSGGQQRNETRIAARSRASSTNALRNLVGNDEVRVARARRFRVQTMRAAIAVYHPNLVQFARSHDNFFGRHLDTGPTRAGDEEKGDRRTSQFIQFLFCLFGFSPLHSRVIQSTHTHAERSRTCSAAQSGRPIANCSFGRNTPTLFPFLNGRICFCAA